jgi:hypothetical protein
MIKLEIDLPTAIMLLAALRSAHRLMGRYTITPDGRARLEPDMKRCADLETRLEIAADEEEKRLRLEATPKKEAGAYEAGGGY